MSVLTFPCPDLSSNIKPFSVPIRRLTPHNAAHKISELNRFLYFRISGVSLVASCDVGVTLTFTWLSRRDGPEPPAPNPNVRKLRCFCWCNAKECGWRLIWLLFLRFIEWFGLLLWRGDELEWFETVEWGDELLFVTMKDLEGVECTELFALTAARYCKKEKRKLVVRFGVVTSDTQREENHRIILGVLLLRLSTSNYRAFLVHCGPHCALYNSGMFKYSVVTTRNTLVVFFSVCHDHKK